MERYEQRAQVKENIDYNYLMQEYPYDDVEGLLELILDVVSSNVVTIRIARRFCQQRQSSDDF